MKIIMMSEVLRVLILEDVSSDAELMAFELSEAGVQFLLRTATDRSTFMEAIDEFWPDIILSDYSLPNFDGLSALRIAREKCPDVPFIFVSGALGEEKAIDLLKEGATDYVLKNRLIRLAPAVLRAFNEAQEKRERRKVEDALKELREMLYTTLENITDAFFTVDHRWRFTYLNRDAERIWKKNRKNLLGESIWDVSSGELRSLIEPQFSKAMSAQLPTSFEAFFSMMNMWINARIYPTPSGLAVYFQDISERKKKEEAIRESESLYHLFFQNSVAGTFRAIYDISENPAQTDGWFIDCNESFSEMLGYDRRNKTLNLNVKDIFFSKDDLSGYTKDLVKNRQLTNYQLRLKRKDGNPVWILLNAALRDHKDGLMMVEGTMADITERVEAETKLVDSNERLRNLTSELITTEERERRQIAVDLHDNIGQTLAVTKMKLDSLSAEVSGDAYAEHLKEVVHLINQSIQQTRNLMTELSPTVLYELGFIAGMEYLIEQIRMQYGINVIFKNNLKTAQFDQEVQLLLFRATRELLLNVVRHANAKEAFVNISKISSQIRVIIEDHGQGFDPKAQAQDKNHHGGFGLLSIQERFKYLGGLCKIETEMGKGTRVTLTAPVKIEKRRH